MPVFVDATPNAFNALAFGMPHQGTLNFLENRVAQTSEYLTQTGREFMARGVELFNRYGGAEAMRYTKAAIRAVQHAFDPDTISYLNDITSIQQAPLAMQRWIMAEPTVRELYHQQRCDGYSETYIDMHPTDIGRDHYDWRAVMNGVLVDTPDDPDYEWTITNYFDNREEDVQLSLSDKTDIISTWDLVRSLLTPGTEDPTSKYGDSL